MGFKEEWRPVRNFESFYEVSNTGRVRSKDRVAPNGVGTVMVYKGCLRKTFIDRRGYEIVTLYLDRKGFKKKVHRLVAEMFLEPAECEDEVNHINTLKTDNRVENLEWCNRKQNMKHARDSGVMNWIEGEAHYSTSLKNFQVVEIKKLLKEKKLKQRQIAKLFKVSEHVISSIKRGHTWAGVS